MTEKLKLHTPNITDENTAKIAALFPHCVSEGKIDFELLKQELSNSIIDGSQERYQLNWVGKREALLTANAPIAKTLRPCREESVNFDTTENLYIEGDNLDALKLLQETYLNKVKMIYIDPPYNTGNDFIYNDTFNIEKGLNDFQSGLKDEEGNKLIAQDAFKQNSESNGRFHSDWLSMMYPRLKLARNLLRDDGVIFISIDDGEVGNLRRMCDEVFGDDNFEGHIHWRRRHNQPNDATKMIGLVAEHIVSFSKNKAVLKQSGVGKVPLTGSFTNPDNDPRGDWASKPWKVGSDQSGSRYVIENPSGELLDEEWMGDKNTFDALLADNRIIWAKKGSGTPRKKYFKFEREAEGQCATNWWTHEVFGHNQGANDAMTNLMEIKNVFSNPKSLELLSGLISISNAKSNDIILDFFSGSATTAHAVMQLNAEDASTGSAQTGKRKFIMVQIPEACDEKSEAFKAGYKTIADIGKERIRRAGQKIKTDNALTATDLDIGFRVLKVDSSNMNEVYYSPDAINKDDLHRFIHNIKDDRSDEDLLFQVLLDWGVDLTLPIVRQTIDGKTVFVVAHDAIVACFDRNAGVNESFIKELAKIKPLRAVFCDGGFATIV